MLLAAAPQAARMANATPEMVAAELAAYRNAVNTPAADGELPIHCAAAPSLLSLFLSLPVHELHELLLVVLRQVLLHVELHQRLLHLLYHAI